MMEGDRFDKAVDRLLEMLYRWAPLSASFRIALKDRLYLQKVKPKSVLLELGGHAKRIWYSLDCTVIGYDYTRGSGEYVNRIYLPGDIFTDLNSFFQLKATTSKLVVVQGMELLCIGREEFSALKSFDEGFDLMQQIMLTEHDLQVWRGWIMTLRDEQKVREFNSRYPMYHLPNHICASFLQMTPSRFSAIKGNFQS
ncbi:MAG: hypothetical protein EOO88_26210 [Pedobacter sp.]|nr:MAG: hypothetical protein EOO88_26210 [Pedobacter sp.]